MGVRQLDSLLALPELKEPTWDLFLVYNTDGLISGLLAHHLLNKDKCEKKTYGKKMQEVHRKPEGYCTTEFSCCMWLLRSTCLPPASLQVTLEGQEQAM